MGTAIVEVDRAKSRPHEVMVDPLEPIFSWTSRGICGFQAVSFQEVCSHMVCLEGCDLQDNRALKRSVWDMRGHICQASLHLVRRA